MVFIESSTNIFGTIYSRKTNVTIMLVPFELSWFPRGLERWRNETGAQLFRDVSKAVPQFGPIEMQPASLSMRFIP